MSPRSNQPDTVSLLTHPDRLRDRDTQLLQELTATCPELTELARLVREFAELLTPAKGNDAKLTAWITATRAADLPHLHGFTNGLEFDRDAVNAGVTLPHHNGPAAVTITQRHHRLRDRAVKLTDPALEAGLST